MARTPQPRKEATSVRLEPKVKYLVEIAARIQRRSVTNYIEWALEESLRNITLEDNMSDNFGNKVTLDYLKDYLWDINESKRFMILTLNYPVLLTFEEQKLWEIISNHPYLYLIKCPGPWILENINFQALDRDWKTLLKASYDDEEALSILKKSQDKLLPKNMDVDNVFIPENKWQKIKEFMENQTTPQTKEEYEQQTIELHNFINGLIDEK